MRIPLHREQYLRSEGIAPGNAAVQHVLYSTPPTTKQPKTSFY